MIRLHIVSKIGGIKLMQLQTCDLQKFYNDKLGCFETTLDKYGHVNGEMKRDASNKRSELLKTVVNKF
ncbi:MAG: hypothetical protein GX045_02680 [Clostridiaceae bacterium]|jgi:hypothetical protein|nr:hypothetical protein [Clostridiaceae bacterium]